MAGPVIKSDPVTFILTRLWETGYVLSSGNFVIISIVQDPDVNNVSFIPFSTDTVQVIGVYCTVIPMDGWDDSLITKLQTNQIDYSTTTVDLSFDRTTVRELHILIHVEHYISRDTSTEISLVHTSNEYRDDITHRITNALPKGFVNNNDYRVFRIFAPFDI